jgi:cytochrome c
MTRRAVGFLVALPLLLALLSAARADPERGERVFQRCYACHSVVAGEDKLPGPNLHGVLGRRAGTLPGFRFSSAMIDAGAARGLVWTRATLDAFLADPHSVVPGTEMAVPGLSEPGDRRDVIDYLEKAGAAASPGSRRLIPLEVPRVTDGLAAWGNAAEILRAETRGRRPGIQGLRSRAPEVDPAEVASRVMRSAEVTRQTQLAPMT